MVSSSLGILLLSIGLLSFLVRASGPGKRFGHSLTADSNGNLLLFGGYTYRGFKHVNRYQTWDYSVGLHNDLWKFTVATEQWTLLANASATKPPARAFHAASFSGGKLFVHGGNDVMYGNDQRGGASLMKLCGASDLWTYTVATDNWTAIELSDNTCDGISASARTTARSARFAFTIALAVVLLSLSLI